MTNNSESKPWMDASKSDRQRAEELVSAMTLEEKIAQLHGGMKTINIYDVDMSAMQDLSDEEYDEMMTQLRVERHVEGIDSLEIPRMRVTNGPVGVGMGDGYPSPKATALPMTIGLAASFDRDLAYRYGDIIGAETAAYGQHVLEGPAVNIHRTPIGGRNFEYLSEDPFLSGVMGVEVTKAIQDHDVIAMGKHFVLNDQEDERFRHNVTVDEDVMREIYLLPFEMLVKDGDIASIMSSYNRIRGVYGTEYHYTLTDILRNEWGFEGYVQSDFWSTRSAAPAINAGLDLEMPDAKWLNEDNIKSALQDTSLEEKTIDRALIRRFTQMFRFNQFGKEYDPQEVDAKAHGQVAREIGGQGAVLLKNDDQKLPLQADDLNNILIIGQEKFAEKACVGGGGSSKVDPLYTVAPKAGMEDVLAELGAQSRVESFIVADDLSNFDQAEEKIAQADQVIIMAGIIASEGFDLEKPELPNQQNQMISRILAQDSEAVVVLKDSTPMLLPWHEEAKSILEVWNQGTEDGHVVADLIFGRVNPSGKVPTTYAAHEEDLMYYNHPERHPGVEEGAGYPEIKYTEGHQVGYRWFDSQGIKPLYAFGHGLSYTKFDLDAIQVQKANDNTVTVSFNITNQGDRDGAQVVQVYAGIPGDNQPPKRLIGFEKIALEAGQNKTVELSISADDTHHPFSVWDTGKGDFVIAQGDIIIQAGTASDQILAEEKINFD